MCVCVCVCVWLCMSVCVWVVGGGCRVFMRACEDTVDVAYSIVPCTNIP
jgi:hypothetical protein